MTKRMMFSNMIMHYALPSLLILLLGNKAMSIPEEYQTYIIHMDYSYKPAPFETHKSWHLDTLKSLSSSLADANQTLLYSYNHVMHGFSARLTPSQLFELEKSPAHLATYPESFGKLLTTHSPEFLGLNSKLGILPAASFGEDVIIGIIDSGVWPESHSFNDKGMSPVPQRWKGKCENGTAFSPTLCNRKLIGAQYFSKGLHAAGIKISEGDYDSARDYFGHGTHTSSTAGGNHVLGASHFGYAKGTARGIAPRAHIAMYKAVFASDIEKTAASDVLAGMDQAIADGVDIMSLSLGFDRTPYFNDIIATASLSAIEKGIFVVCSAGNDGAYNTILNGAPWITTVGAGTVDRIFTAKMMLGNGLSFEGISIYPDSIYIDNAPLYYGNDNVKKATCQFSSLDPKEITGMVVLCDNSSKVDIFDQLQELIRVGAYAGILMSDTSVLDPRLYAIPILILQTAPGAFVREYITGNKSAKVKSIMFKFTKLGVEPAPQVAEFSSRGPDPINPGVLKPDIMAPGVDILAAIAPNVPHMRLGKYELVADYALFSGTSMSAPHVAGVAALLKAVYPEWSPAGIRSAMMTTAYTIDNTGTTMKNRQTGVPATPLDYGAGHVNPNKAMDPGLIYDMNIQDYIEFLCSIGYNEKQMRALLRRKHWNCSKESTDLNYPSFMAIFNTTASPTVKKFTRVVTNIGADTAVYQASLEIPDGIRVKVEPSTLTFSEKYQKQSFVVTVEIDREVKGVIYGFLKWIDEHNHTVSSPIVVIN